MGKDENMPDINSSVNNKRIAKNTLLLYVRMLFLMLISLYTSRVILNVLGVEDYGIYNVVGGVVAMFSMISASLNSAISRFITYDLGVGDFEKLKKTFSSSVTIQMGLAAIFIVISETLGLWFLNNKMIIPSDRLLAANWCLQLSVLTISINLISVPYNAAIIAHEKMSAFAYISVIEAAGKLLIAWLILLSPIDRLVFYAIMLAVMALIIRFIYMRYCKCNFSECDYSFIYDYNLLRKMFGFAGWNMIGTSSAVLRNQGGDILINLFFGPAVNGAKAIATQINGAIDGFVQNFMIALNPQITKSYANGNHEYMLDLVLKGSKFSFYILLLLGLPLLINTEFVLQIWLKMVPAHAVLFVQLTILLIMSDCLSHTLVAAILAEGEIKSYMAAVGGLQLMNVPISCVVLWLGGFPEMTVIVAILLSQVCLIARLFFLRKKVKLSIREFFLEVYVNVILVSVAASIIPLCIVQIIPAGWLSFMIVSTIAIVCTFFAIYVIGLSNSERQMLLCKGKDILLRIK